MIVGLGVDIVNITRIENITEKYKTRFINRILTEQERNAKPIALDKMNAYLAKRFAIKEAFVKALGTGFRFGISFHDINTINDQNGKLFVQVTGKALIYLQNNYNSYTIHASVADDYPFACATVIVEEINT